MSMTSRISGTRRLERAAVLRILASRKTTANESEFRRMGRYPVFNLSWAGDSRFFRHLQEIHGTFCTVLGRVCVEDKRVIGRRAVQWGLWRRVTQSLVPAIQMVRIGWCGANGVAGAGAGRGKRAT